MSMKRASRSSMLAAMLLATAGLVVGAAAPSKHPAASAEKQLRAATDQFAAAWNRGDGKALAAMFADKADIINPFGRAARGRAELGSFFEQQLATRKGTVFAIKDVSSRMLRPDVALLDFTVEVSGGELAAGRAVAHQAFAVVTRQGAAAWQFQALRAFVPQEPSPAAGK